MYQLQSTERKSSLGITESCSRISSVRGNKEKKALLVRIHTVKKRENVWRKKQYKACFRSSKKWKTKDTLGRGITNFIRNEISCCNQLKTELHSAWLSPMYPISRSRTAKDKTKHQLQSVMSVEVPGFWKLLQTEKATLYVDCWILGH